MLYSIEQTDADLAAVFSKWYTGTTEHRMHYDSAYTKISANSGVDLRRPLTPYFGQLLRTFAHSMIQAPNSFHTWMNGTCGSNRSTHCRQSPVSQWPPDQSTLPYSPPRHWYGDPPARTPFHLSSKTRSHSH